MAAIITNANTPWREHQQSPKPLLIDYDRNCIQHIKDAFTSYVQMHGEDPTSVSVGPYEMQEIKKAKQAGEKMEVVIEGKKHQITIWGCAE